MIARAKLNKIPGLMPVAKSENRIKDLTSLTRWDLLEIKEREEKLLANKANIIRLPDKGKRIQDFYDKVLQELENRCNVDEAAAMFSELNIASKGKMKLNQLEWEGVPNCNNNSESNPLDDVLDSDDEIEMDPLKIIAQCNMHEKKTKIILPEPELITESDLEEIKSFESNAEILDADIVSIDVCEKMSTLRPKFQQIIDNSMGKQGSQNKNSSSSGSTTPSNSTMVSECSTDSDKLDSHVLYIVNKVIDKMPAKEKFKPYKTTVSNVHDPEKEKLRIHGKHWENTAATPPFIQHNGTKLLTLLDSVDIQTNYLAKLKELQEKQAAERLAAKMERMANKIEIPSDVALKSNVAFTTYRVPSNQIEGSRTYLEEFEVPDPLDEDLPGGAVNYTVFE